jgi:hypothetical protein
LITDIKIKKIENKKLKHLPNGSGILKKRSFLTRPSAAMTVRRTVFVELGMVNQNPFYIVVQKKKKSKQEKSFFFFFLTRRYIQKRNSNADNEQPP